MPPDLATLVGNADAFPVLQHWDFFNHAAVSPLPRAAADALRTYAVEAERGAYLDTHWYAQIEQLRLSAARMLNAHRDEIALVKNTSDGLSIIANGIDWKPGDRVVTTAVEFPANHYPWMDVARRFGTEMVFVPEHARSDGAAAVPLDSILQALDHPKTRLLTLSHVQYASGQRNDLAALGAFCRQRNILFCVDAIQSMGVLPLDVRAMNIDYLSADGHKWLLGPEGAGLLYVRRELLDATRPTNIGWLNFKNFLDYASRDFVLKPDAGRYEPGSYNVPGCLALKASLELLLGVGVDRIAARMKDLGDRLATGLVRKGYRVVSPRDAGQWSGAVCFTSPTLDQKRLVADLRRTHRIELAFRENRIRCSPHFYNTEAQLDRLLDVLPAHG